MFGLTKSDDISISDFFMKKYEVPDDLRKVIETNIEEIYKEKKLVKKEKKKVEETNKKKDEKKKKIEEDWVIGYGDFSEIVDINKQFNKNENIKENKNSKKSDNNKNNKIEDKKESHNLDNNNENKDEKTKFQTVEQFLYGK